MPTIPDITIQIISEHARSEQRINPSWTLTRLKSRLAPITGIPVAAQSLSLRLATGRSLKLDQPNASDDDTIELSSFLPDLGTPGAEIHLADTRPASQRENYTDVSTVTKYEMSTEDYERLPDSVLAWKRTHQLGRFDPAAPEIAQRKVEQVNASVEQRGVVLGARCRLLPERDHRRGRVAFVGEVAELPGLGAWIGVELDEPVGKNDGTVNGKRYFDTSHNCGVFVRPDRIEMGEFHVLDELNDEEF